MKTQFTFRLAVVVAAIFAWLAVSHAGPVTMPLVYVGDPGNTADTTVMTDGSKGYGSVPYGYNIGKYDVTLTQYCAFLNAVAATDTYNLYYPILGTDWNVAGIIQHGNSGSYTYSVFGSGQRPVTYVSWYDAARFANWLTHGQPTGPQGNNTTETGVYTFTGATTITALPVDHSALVGTGAKWFLPTENEWYKAAYYKGGSTNAGYWLYPFKSNTQPTQNYPYAGVPNSGNFETQSSGLALGFYYYTNQNYLTDVGTYYASPSPYGSFDMGGDVFQWNEGLTGPPWRDLRGGWWHDFANALGSQIRTSGADPTTAYDYLGFRVAELPEPSSIALFALGTIGVVFATRRRKLNARA